MGDITHRHDSTDAQAYIVFARDTPQGFQDLVRQTLDECVYLSAEATDLGLLIDDDTPTQEADQ